MRCNICHANLILIINAKTQARKGLILCNFTNGINALKKHVYANHCVIAKIFKEEINNLSKESFEIEPTKKWPHANGTTISKFFIAKDSYKKDDVQQK